MFSLSVGEWEYLLYFTKKKNNNNNNNNNNKSNQIAAHLSECLCCSYHFYELYSNYLVLLYNWYILQLMFAFQFLSLNSNLKSEKFLNFNEFNANSLFHN